MNGVSYKDLSPKQTFGLLSSVSGVSRNIISAYESWLVKQKPELSRGDIMSKVELIFFEFYEDAIKDHGDPVREFLNKHNILSLGGLIEKLKDENFKTELETLNRSVPHILKFSGFYAPDQRHTDQLEPTGDTYLFMEEHCKLYSRQEIGGNYIMRCKQSDILKNLLENTILTDMVTNCYWSHFTY